VWVVVPAHCSRLHRLAESIPWNPGLLKRLQIRALFTILSSTVEFNNSKVGALFKVRKFCLISVLFCAILIWTTYLYIYLSFGLNERELRVHFVRLLKILLHILYSSVLHKFKKNSKFNLSFG
jgi:hypothetical protein